MLQHLDSTTKKLIGLGITEITRKSESQVELLLDDGTRYQVNVEGDCCSSSIFYETVFPDETRNAPITDVITSWWDKEDAGVDNEATALAKTKIAFPDFGPEENRVWDVVIVTAKGDIRLRHINSSNGYYDGCVSFYEV